MPRRILNEADVDSQIADRVGGGHAETLDEIERALKDHSIVLIGMAHNPYVKKARKLLDLTGKSYHYLEYGSYTKAWKQRLAIKMWVGWPTFPMVFVNGRFIGGKQELESWLKGRGIDALLKIGSD